MRSWPRHDDVTISIALSPSSNPSIEGEPGPASGFFRESSSRRSRGWLRRPLLATGARPALSTCGGARWYSGRARHRGGEGQRGAQACSPAHGERSGGGGEGRRGRRRRQRPWPELGRSSRFRRCRLPPALLLGHLMEMSEAVLGVVAERRGAA